jgi:replicative DNA helicase
MSERKMLKQLDINSNQEDLFLTGMIVSEEFMKGIIHVIEPRFFCSPHIRTVCGWAIEYYEEFKKVPGSQIQEIFDIESRNAELADKELIETLLINISTKYTHKPFNSGYLLPKMLDYLRERVVEIAIEDAKWNLKKKGPDAAWMTLNEIKKVSSKMPKGVTFFRDFDDRFEGWYYRDKQEIMRFPGALGNYFAPILRKKLLAFMGKPKSGKSWWLLYCAYIAVTYKLNVAFFSLEMDTSEVEERLACMLTAREFGDGRKMYKVPVFDCMKNQDGTCVKSICTNPGESILEEDGKAPDYLDTPHVICDVCRRDWAVDDQDTPSDYDFSSWMEEEEFEKLSAKQIGEAVERFRLHFGQDQLKIFSHRIGTATIQDLEDELDHVEQIEGWIPDALIVDYADILKKNGAMSERRHQLSDIWEQLSGMCKERNVAGFTASQGNRGSVSKSTLTSEDIAEDFGKVMIVDGLIGINEDNASSEKTGKDKYWQRQNLKWIAHRHKKDLREWEKCVVLNNLTLGQVYVDSEII